jgi:hypothetical protein
VQVQVVASAGTELCTPGQHYTAAGDVTADEGTDEEEEDGYDLDKLDALDNAEQNDI